MTLVMDATRLTGSKSRSGSNPVCVCNWGMTVIMASPIAPMVYPSATERATRSCPVKPAAAGMFSITSGWPMLAAIFWVTMRMTVSPAVPACIGTMTLMARAG